MDFLNRLFDWLFQFIPQFEIVGPDEKAVRITCIPFVHKWCRTLGFGWYVFWPLFQEMFTLNVKPQILTVEVVREDDRGPVYTSISTWAIQYFSRDVYKTMFEVEDHEERLAAHAIKVIGNCIEKGEPVDEKALSEIRAGVSGFGLWIQEVLPQQNAHVLSLKLFTENMSEKLGRIIGCRQEQV
jgi:hypothetical protein